MTDATENRIRRRVWLLFGVALFIGCDNTSKKKLMPAVHRETLGNIIRSTSIVLDGGSLIVASVNQFSNSVITYRDPDSLTPQRPDLEVEGIINKLLPTGFNSGLLVEIEGDPDRHGESFARRIDLYEDGVRKRTIVESSMDRPFSSMSVAADGSKLAVCLGGKETDRPACHIYTLPEGEMVATVEEAETGTLHAQFTDQPDQPDRLVVLRGWNGYSHPSVDRSAHAMLVSVESNQVLARKTLPDEGYAGPLVRSADGTHFYTTVGRSGVHLAVHNETVEVQSVDAEGFTRLNYHQQKGLVAFTTGIGDRLRQNGIVVVDLSKPRNSARRFSDGTPGIVECMVFSNDGMYIYAGVTNHDKGFEIGFIEKYLVDERK